VAPSPQFDFTQTNTCGSSLATGSSCQISVVFRPSFSGLLIAQMIIDNSSGKSHVVELSGTSLDQNTVDTLTSPTSFSFGSQLAQSSSAPQTFTFNNVHGVALNVVSVNTTSEFAVTSEDCTTKSPISPTNGCS